MMYYIYCVTNKINGKTYIGQRKCPKGKTPESDCYMGSGLLLHKAFEKYGKEIFSKTIIAIAECKENINVLEKVFIALYRAGGKAEYNIADGGDGGNLGEEVNKKLRGENNPFYGKHHSEESKAKNREKHLGKIPSDLARKNMSKSQKGRKHSEETKKKISDSNKGKIFTEKTKQKLSESHNGQVAWNKGKRLPEEIRKRMGRKKGCVPWNKGKHGIYSDECIKKMRNSAKLRCGDKSSFYGKKHSEETKRKISNANKGRIAWNKGKSGFVISDETKRKMSEKCKGLCWFNDGVKEVKARVCPYGFIKGRLKKIKEGNYVL